MANFIEKQILIRNKLGLHARAATKLAVLSNQFQSDIYLKQDDKSAPANSVMGLLMLESSQGKYVTVTVEGGDSPEALKAIENLINNKFDEQE